MAKIKIRPLTNDKDLSILGMMGVCDLLSTGFCTWRTSELCFQPWYFLMMNKRGLTLNCVVFLWEGDALLLCAIPMTLLTSRQSKNFKTKWTYCQPQRKNKEWYNTSREMFCKLDQNCRWTYSCAFCSGTTFGATRHLPPLQIHPPFQMLV